MRSGKGWGRGLRDLGADSGDGRSSRGHLVGCVSTTPIASGDQVKKSNNNKINKKKKKLGDDEDVGGGPMISSWATEWKSSGAHGIGAC